MKRFNPEKIGEFIARSLLLEQGFAKEEETRQDKLSSKIDKLKLRAPKDSGEETITDEDDDAEDNIDPKPKPESDPEEVSNEQEDTGDGAESIGGKGEEFEVTAPAYIPTQLNIKDIERQLNNLRAGKSLKDEEISGELETYFQELGQGEQQALFTYLASLAAIMTGGSSGAAAPRPQNLDVDIDIEPQRSSDGPERVRRETQKQKAKKKEKIPLGDSAPIVVGEWANKVSELRTIFENSSYGEDHKCISGVVVPFGSQGCVDDLECRISDLTDLRNNLAGGTADRASLNGTLKYLRQKKRRANKLLEADAESDQSQEEDERVQGELNLADEA